MDRTIPELLYVEGQQIR